MEDNSYQYSSELYSLANRIIKVKIRLLSEHPFFGLLAQHVKMAIDTEVKTACTDGEKIYFGQEFSQNIGDEELYFVFFHELMHIVYKHCFRGKTLNNYLYNIAADIVINSVILDELKLQDIFICGTALMHKTPDGEEGRIYTAEEVYAMLVDEAEADSTLEKLITANGGVMPDANGNGNNNSGKNNDPKGKLFKSSDVASSSKQSKRESEKPFDKKRAGGGEKANDSDGIEKNVKGGSSGLGDSEDKDSNGGAEIGISDDFFFDDHSKWGESKSNELNEAKWQQNIYDAVKVLEGSKSYGTIPSLAKRMVEEIQNPPIDWRTILINFIQTDVYDYSFSPPDRRYDGSGFLLPDFNEKEDKMENVWIAIDSSGSISDKQLSLALNEIKGAIEQYNGKFSGWVSFFDYHVTKPQPFEDLEDIKRLELYGGGGTSFENIFKARRDYFDEDLSCIIIITDGYAPWPKESDADGIPVLWLFNNLNVKPPWGIVARMNIKERD